MEGAAVAQLQAAFIDNWIKTRSKVLLGEPYFPETEATGGSLAQVYKSSRTSGTEGVRLMYLLSITSAEKPARLQAACFVPDELSIRTFVAAREGGVTVEIIVPGRFNDS